MNEWMNVTNQTVYLPKTSPKTFSLNHRLDFAHLLPIWSVLLRVIYIMAKNEEHWAFSLCCYRVVFQSLSFLSLPFAFYSYHPWLFLLEQKILAKRSTEKTCATVSCAVLAVVFVSFRPRLVSFDEVTTNGIQMTFQYRNAALFLTDCKTRRSINDRHNWAVLSQ